MITTQKEIENAKGVLRELLKEESNDILGTNIRALEHYIASIQAFLDAGVDSPIQSPKDQPDFYDKVQIQEAAEEIKESEAPTGL